MTLTTATIILLTIISVTAVLSILAAVANWDWFFNSANSLFGFFSRRTARILAALLGIALLFMTFKILDDTFPSLF